MYYAFIHRNPEACYYSHCISSVISQEKYINPVRVLHFHRALWQKKTLQIRSFSFRIEEYKLYSGALPTERLNFNFAYGIFGIPMLRCVRLVHWTAGMILSVVSFFCSIAIRYRGAKRGQRVIPVVFDYRHSTTLACFVTSKEAPVRYEPLFNPSPGQIAPKENGLQRKLFLFRCRRTSYSSTSIHSSSSRSTSSFT